MRIRTLALEFDSNDPNAGATAEQPETVSYGLNKEDYGLIIEALRSQGEAWLSSGGSPPRGVIAKGTNMCRLADELEAAPKREDDGRIDNALASIAMALGQVLLNYGMQHSSVQRDKPTQAEPTPAEQKPEAAQ